MTLLLMLAGLLLLFSGGMKVRSGLRIGLGVDVFTIAELLFALVIGFAALSSLALGPAAATGWLIPAGVLLVLVSTTVYVFKMSTYRRRRELLVGRRLETYVKYLYQLEEPTDTEE